MGEQAMEEAIQTAAKRTTEENERLSALNKSQIASKRTALENEPSPNTSGMAGKKVSSGINLKGDSSKLANLGKKSSKSGFAQKAARGLNAKAGQPPGSPGAGMASPADKPDSSGVQPKKIADGQQQAAAAEQFKQKQQQQRLEQKKQEISAGGGIDEQKKKAQEEIRKQAKVALRRGLTEVLTSICGALDIGSGGVTAVVNWIITYPVALVDLNLQMIWGYYITKKKSFFFPALEWSPIPMPSVISVKFLHIGLVVLDLLILMLLFIGLAITAVVICLPAMIVAGGATSVYALISDPVLRTMAWDMFIELF